MTTRQSYDVDPEQLRGHAGRLAAHADQLSSIGAPLPGELGELSLGAFAQFISAGIGSAMAETADALRHSSSTLDMVSDGLRRAADRYQDSDEDHAATFSALGTTLEEDIR